MSERFHSFAMVLCALSDGSLRQRYEFRWDRRRAKDMSRFGFAVFFGWGGENFADIR
jgi:hypothetical protein